MSQPIDFTSLRLAMVQHQLAERDIRDDAVLTAMQKIPREAFVPEELAGQAYEDGPLRIGYGQTISQPYTVAFMAQALQLRGNERVLEIGTGSGYGAAVLSELADQVYTTERIVPLAERAQQKLRELGIDNVTVHVTDGSEGLLSHAPFDAIVSTAAAEQLPEVLLDQLAEGGRLVIPVGPQHAEQHMLRYTRIGNRYSVEELGVFSFVPLVRGTLQG